MMIRTEKQMADAAGTRDPEKGLTAVEDHPAAGARAGVRTPGDDWNPVCDAVMRDPAAVYDDMRERCPVAHSERLGWTIFRHRDVSRVLHDPDTFSNAVSTHLSVPNGMDPPEHTAFRRLIERYLTARRVGEMEPACRSVARDLSRGLDTAGPVELMNAFARPFAVRVQCALLAWPACLHEPLLQWTARNQHATRVQDRTALAELAGEFEQIARAMLEQRRSGALDGTDVTTGLLRDRVRGRPLKDEEIVSVLRNWTVGEIGTISAAVGIVAHFLARHPEAQALLRREPDLLDATIDEILRLHGPLVTNRRVATRVTELGGRRIEAGDRVSINWVAANRDDRVFEDAEEFRLDRNPADNLLYGAGIHVCPGAGLARMQLRVVTEELLRATGRITPLHSQPATWAHYPASGFDTLPLRIQ